MQLSYNGFIHPRGQVNVRYRFDAIENEAAQIVAYKGRFDIIGKLISQEQTIDACQADLNAQIDAIQSAYVDGGDLLLLLDNGQKSENSVLSSDAIGGTRVVQRPSFPDGGYDQFATQRDFTIAIEAELPEVDSGVLLWSFEESITFQGSGGPSTDAIECVVGLPIMQTLKQHTAVTAVQEGRAVGYLRYATPLYPPPIWPAQEQLHLRVQTVGSPRLMGRGINAAYKMFPSTWRYTFKSPKVLIGTPNLWPI